MVSDFYKIASRVLSEDEHEAYEKGFEDCRISILGVLDTQLIRFIQADYPAPIPEIIQKHIIEVVENIKLVEAPSAIRADTENIEEKK